MATSRYILFMTLILILSFNKLHSQDTTKVYVYEVKKHTMNVASSDIGFSITVEGILDKEELKEYQLVVKGNKSVFHEKAFTKIEGFNLNFGTLTTNGIDTTYIDHNTEKFIQKKRFHKIDTLMVWGELPKINWKITDEQKEINGFLCKKAEAKIKANDHFHKSETIEAWFNEELSNHVAPEKYFGLPGGIVYLTTKERDYSLTENHSNITKSYEVREPRIGKPTTQKRLRKMLDDYLKTRDY